MPLDQIANFIRGNTDAAVDSTQTTISVVDATVFPDPANGEYNLVLWDSASHPRPDQDTDTEIVRVTARDTGTNDLTVTRGQEGTAGASHPSGSALQLSPTAALFGDVAATDTPVEDFPTNSTTNGEVLTAQGDGSAAFAAAPNSPNWVEDANSPIDVTGQTSVTYTLDGTYDETLIIGKVTDTSGNSNVVDLRVNGDSGNNYNGVVLDGTTVTDNDEFRLINLAASGSSMLRANISGTWSGALTTRLSNASTNPGNDSYGWSVGKNDFVSSPLTDFTIVSASSRAFDLTARVYGLNL